MNILKRFQRLSTWNKLAALGSIASLVSLAYLFWPQPLDVTVQSHGQQGGITAREVNISGQTINIGTSSTSATTPAVLDAPVRNFASRYTLAADMDIRSDFVRVEGIGVRGNVRVGDATGVQLREMRVLGDDQSSGNINIDRSKNFNVKDNDVARAINVDRSGSFNVSGNSIGSVVDRDRQAQHNINIVLRETSSPHEVILGLRTLQSLIGADEVLANALGSTVARIDKQSSGLYRSNVQNHLKKLGVETLQQAEAKGIGMAFHWLDYFLHFKTGE